MSVFSILKRGRQAKRQSNGKRPQIQSDKQAGKQKEDLSNPRYHHVPTHAAADALLGAPAGWMRDDAQRIRENNRKRTAIDAAKSVRTPRSGSSSMLSPLHIDMHSGSSTGSSSRYVYSSANGSSSSSSNLSPCWSRATSSLSTRKCLSSKDTPTSYTCPDYSSLDAEIYRARISATDADDTSRTPRRAPVAAISPSPSLTSSSPTASSSSSPSTSPTACPTPYFGPCPVFKSKDGNDYIEDADDEYNLARPESFEMKVLASNATTISFGSRTDIDTNKHARSMHSQHELPSTGLQQRRRQHNPYAHPAEANDPLPLRFPAFPREELPRSSIERNLVPATIRSPGSSPASTTLNLQPAVVAEAQKSAPNMNENKTKKTGTIAVETLVVLPRALHEQKHTQRPPSTPTQIEVGFF